MTALSPNPTPEKGAAVFPPTGDLEQAAHVLDGFLKQAPAEAVIGAALGRFEDKFALVSSFGAESAVLLHMAAKISKDIPVLFLDTGKLFGETKRYRDQLVERLNLQNVITVIPDETRLENEDPKGHLWAKSPNRCCFIRKVAPLHEALQGYHAWASGRKRFQGGLRSEISHFEFSDGRVKVNPLAHWTRDDIDIYLNHHELPRHPLVAEGFSSVGCMPCTERSDDGTDSRSGRWAGSNKVECGIHLSWQKNLELFNEGGGI